MNINKLQHLEGWKFDEIWMRFSCTAVGIKGKDPNLPRCRKSISHLENCAAKWPGIPA